MRIATIVGSNDSYVIVNPFSWQPQLDSLFYMPVVVREAGFKVVQGTVSTFLVAHLIIILVLLLQDILCHINLQHQCCAVGCDTTAFRVVRQERLDTSLTQATTNHKDTIHFLVNVHSMTNSQLIRDLVTTNCVAAPLFFAPETHPEIRCQSLSLLRDQNNEKKKKKADAGM